MTSTEQGTRFHMEEPIEMTNPRASVASQYLADVERHHSESSDDQVMAYGALIQAHATLALAQEVKNLRQSLEALLFRNP